MKVQELGFRVLDFGVWDWCLCGSMHVMVQGFGSGLGLSGIRPHPCKFKYLFLRFGDSGMTFAAPAQAPDSKIRNMTAHPNP